MKYTTTLSTIILSAGILEARKPFQLFYSHQFENSGSESVTVDRANIRGGAPLYRKNGNLLVLGLRASLDQYNFNNTNANWDTIQSTELGIGFRWKINEQWLWANYASIAISREEGASKSDAYNHNLISIAEYKFNDALTIGPGFGISNKLDEGASIFPIIALKWQINDEWQLNSGPSEVTATGANIYINYRPKKFHDNWDFTLGSSYSSKNFRIKDTSLAAKMSGEESLFSVYLAATYRHQSGLRVSPVIGYQITQNYTTFDNTGRERSKDKLDPAAYVGINFGWEF